MMDKSFEELLEINCFSESQVEREAAAEWLESRYGCEIRCSDMDRSVRFAHHARGCTIVAAKLCKNVVIYQNVTIGSNMRYHLASKTWENVGNPILAENVIVADGAKILGPIVIKEHSVIGAGAIVTKDIPANSVVYGVNQWKPKDPSVQLVFHRDMIDKEEIKKANERLIENFHKRKSPCVFGGDDYECDKT